MKYPKPPKAIRLKGKALEDLRRSCYERDNGACQMCTNYVSWEEGHMAHIKRRAKGGDILSNVRLLCFDCHIRIEHGGYENKA